jgi:ferric-dicitrate binding protein FerR (iron transport regulator)
MLSGERANSWTRLGLALRLIGTAMRNPRPICALRNKVSKADTSVRCGDMSAKQCAAYQRAKGWRSLTRFARRWKMKWKPNAGFVPAMVVAALWMVTQPAAAQSGKEGCKVTDAGAQKIWSCPGGLTIVEENGARFTLDDRDHDGNVDLVRLWAKALLLDLIEGSGHDVQVVTPQAITAVRGTKWAVDAGDGKTSVFVVRGAVGVRRPHAGGEVVLGPGAGVDADADSSALHVKQWGEARIRGLMARFGQ